MKRYRLVLLAAVASAALTALAGADEPKNFSYAPQPPGAIVQSQVVYLAGEAMHSQWRAVLSKKPVGHDATRAFYQWFLSVYAIDGMTYHLKYQSPKDGGPFSTVSKAHGAQLWFPVQDASLAGEGELMGPGVQQLVVVSREAAADCGMARVDVLFDDAAMRAIVPTLQVENGCDLSAKIVHDARGTALAVSGPYYARSAALCCPTKNHATAIFRFHNGTWTQTPRYFKVLKSP